VGIRDKEDATKDDELIVDKVSSPSSFTTY